jgi:hypothetical protein
MSEAHEQINTALTAYCRGVDRLDADSLRSAFHDDAALEGYGPSDRTVDEFIEMAMTGLARAYTATQHRISNITIEVTDDKARVESYVMADHFATEPRRIDTFKGRYVDDFACREGQWRMVRRRLLRDWSEVTEIGDEMAGVYADSQRDRQDPIYSGL